MTYFRSHWVRLGAVLAVGALTVTACGSSLSKDTAADSKTPVNLKVNFWGDFGSTT